MLKINPDRIMTKENRMFAAMQFISNTSFCIPIGFLVVVLKNLGYADNIIALIMSGTILFTIVALPVYGYLSDYFITVKKLVLASTVITFVFVGLMPFFGRNLGMAFFLYCGLSVSTRALPSVMDGYVTKLALRRSGLSYSTTRAFGSLGYALTAIAIGRVMDNFGFNIIFFIDMVLLVIQFLWALRLEDVPLSPRKKREKGKAGDGGAGFFETIRRLCKIPMFVVYTAATTISYLGTNGAQSFLALLIFNVGGNNGHVGMAMAFMAFSEVAVLLLYQRVLGRARARNVLIVSMFGFLLKITLFSISSSVAMVLLTCFAQSVSYAIFLPSSMKYIRELVPENMLATAVTFSSAINGSVSTMAGVLAAGNLISRHGIVFVFRIAVVLCLLGALAFAAGALLDKRGGKAKRPTPSF